MRSPAHIAKALSRQATINGDKTKAKEFKEDALATLKLQFFALMKLGNPMVQVIHSAYRCPNDEMPRDVRRKGVGYVGDRTTIANPVPVEIPPEKGWSFYTENVVVSGVDMVAHYGQDGVDPEGYWELGVSAAREKACVPYLLAIPLIVAEFLMEREGT